MFAKGRVGWRYLAGSAVRHHALEVRRWARRLKSPFVRGVAAAQTHGGHHHIVEPAQDVALRPPHVLDRADRRSLVRRDVRSVPEQFVLELTGAQVRGRDGWVYYRDRLVEDVWQEDGHSSRAEAPLVRRSADVHLDGLTVSLLQPWSPNYYHWTVQAVPRLLAVRELLGGVDRVDHWLVPVNGPAAVDEWLDAVGVPRARRFPVANRSTTVHTDRLLVASVPGRNRWVSSAVVRGLREAAPTSPGSGRGPRLLLQRAAERRRLVLNFQEVLEALTPLGFEVVDPGELTLAEEATTFGEAEVVVGVHGAGLTNLVYCRPGAAVVELTPRGLVHPTFVKLAAAAGVRHRMVVGREPRLPAGLRFPDIHADTVVDVPRLLEAVEDLSRSPRSGVGF